MDKVVYFLGAGFSAAYGLPVMSNFHEMARDLFFSDVEGNADLKPVLEMFSQYSVIKNYFNADLFNIEELLSILVMNDELGDGESSQDFVEFIAQTIEHYTPSFKRTQPLAPSEWKLQIVGGRKRHKNWGHENDLGHFAANILGLEVKEMENQFPESDFEVDLVVRPSKRRAVGYGVVTLNYDMLLENCASFFDDYFSKPEGFRPTFHPVGFFSDIFAAPMPVLAKLHGSVDSRNLIPPTWKKGITKDIQNHWRSGFQLIADANHIRFVGYSLPTADAYVKYLLKAAIANSEHLKSITVICHDNDGEVEQRYRDFITFPNMVFINTTTQSYLDGLRTGGKCSRDRLKTVCFDNLEAHHESFVEEHCG